MDAPHDDEAPGRGSSTSAGEQDPRRLGVLAEGLYDRAHRLLRAGRFAQARAALEQCRARYRDLARHEPGRAAVALCDVRLCEALANLLEGDLAGASAVGRQALAEYGAVTAGDPWERDFGAVRAHALLGRALLTSGRPAQALEEFDAALFAAEALRERTGLPGTDFGWLAEAPPSFRRAAPEWLAAAVAAMELHDAAGRWGIAADAANIAMRVAGGLAGLGGRADRDRFAAVHARAQEVWRAAEQPLRTAALRVGPLGEALVSAAGIVIGPRSAPDLARIWRLAGWGDPPAPAAGTR